MLVMLVAGCDDGGAPVEPGPGPGPGGSNARVVVWPTSLTLNPTNVFTLETSVENLAAGQTATFTCTSSQPSIATADNCQVRALTNGSATITVTSAAAPNNPATVPVTVNNQTASCASLFGSHVYSVAVTSDPGGRAGTVGLPGSIQLNITRNPDNTVTVFAGSPFIAVSGITSLNCDLSAAGTGSTGGTSNVSARLSGATSATPIAFRYILGANGAFPGGQPIVYTLTRQ